MTNPATQVVEARRSDIQEHYPVTKQVEGHPRLHETLYQKMKQTNKKKPHKCCGIQAVVDIHTYNQ